MPALVGRTLVSILLIPVAALLYVVAAVLVLNIGHISEHHTRHLVAYCVAGAIAWVFLAMTWLAIWRRTVRWTRKRIVCTWCLVPGSILVGGTAGAMFDLLVKGYAAFLGSVLAPLLWLILSVVFWSNTPEEEQAHPVEPRCPKCGYNLTGLRELRCPECGSQFTLGEIIQSYSAR